MANQSIESRTFNEFHPKLRSSIANGVSTLASKALAQELITRQQLAECREGNIYKQADTFLLQIGAKIDEDESNLDTFIQILKGDLVYHKLASQIEEKTTLKIAMKKQTRKKRGSNIKGDFPDSEEISSKQVLLYRSASEEKEFSAKIEAAKIQRKRLRRKFSQLVISTKNCLKRRADNKEIKFFVFRDEFILMLSESLIDDHQGYFEEKRKDICNASNFDELFFIFNFRWNYLNPSLLEHFIAEYNVGGGLRQEIEQYNIELEAFRKDTELKVFWEVEPPKVLASPPNNFKEICTEHNLSGACTLQDVENIRLSIASKLQLRRFALFIAQCRTGSVIVVWYVTPRVFAMIEGHHATFKILLPSSKHEDTKSVLLPTETSSNPIDEVLPSLEQLFLESIATSEITQQRTNDSAIDQGSTSVVTTDITTEVATEVTTEVSTEVTTEVTTDVTTGKSSSKHLQEAITSTSDIQSETDRSVDPTSVRECLIISVPGPNSPKDFTSDSYGKWMVVRPLHLLDKTWHMIRKVVESGVLKCMGAKSTTGMYNPSSTGTGPCITGVVSVFTKEEDMEAVGLDLIGYVKQDITYKTVEATLSSKYRTRGDRHIATKILYWNGGNPSTESKRKHKHPHWTQPSMDKDTWYWQLNHAESEHVLEPKDTYGKWIVSCKIEHLTDQWHTIRREVESDRLGRVKMVCPKQKPPVILMSTAEDNIDVVYSALKEMDKNFDLRYVPEQHKLTPKYKTA